MEHVDLLHRQVCRMLKILSWVQLNHGCHVSWVWFQYPNGKTVYLLTIGLARPDFIHMFVFMSDFGIVLSKFTLFVQVNFLECSIFHGYVAVPEGHTCPNS